jgi:hypothetical protein
MDKDLCKPYSNEEIKVTLFQMGATKAHVSDGFPVIWILSKMMFMILSEDFFFRGGADIYEGVCI